MQRKQKDLFKDKVFLSVMLVCLVLLVVATAATLIYNHSKEDESTYLGLTETAANLDVAVNGQEETYEVGQEVLAENDSKEAFQTPTESEAASLANSGQVAAASLNFSADSTMLWPCQGEVIKDYSMDTTVYYATLNQYKVCPGMMISQEPGTMVNAPADGFVKVVGEDEEIGHYVQLDLGNGYVLTLGNLDQIAVRAGEYVTKSQELAVLAEPTKYYLTEGPNLYLKLTKDGTPIDPKDFLE